MNEERWIEYLPVDELEPAPTNAKRHDAEVIGASMDRFGYVEAITLDERTGRIVAGHGRREQLLAKLEAGEPAPDGVREDAGRWYVPVQRGWSSADDTEAEAYGITANRSTEAGGWDDDDLVAALARVEQSDLGLTGIGFDGDDLAALRHAGAGSPRQLTLIDDAPPLPETPITRPGDLWLLGPHRLVCGDATVAEQVARVLDGPPADAMVTDPPYCSGGFQEAGRSSGSIGTSAAITPRIANDSLSTRGYTALLKSVITLGAAPLLYIFTDWRMWVNLFDVVESSGYGVRNMIVWDKGSAGMGRGWRTQHELVMFGAAATVAFDNHKAQGNVIDAKRTGNPLHPTQKPVDLLSKILAVTDMARTIYDPFAGSGSTLIAAHQEGRVARLLELDPAFCDVICTRWAEHTGEAATHAETGKPHPGR